MVRKKPKTTNKIPKPSLKVESLVVNKFSGSSYKLHGVVTSANVEEFTVNWFDDGNPLAKFAFSHPIKWKWGWLEGDTHGDNPVSKIKKVRD